jgi:hypothetical protein
LRYKIKYIINFLASLSSFIQSLEIDPENVDETLIAIATEELRQINYRETPSDKILCVVSLNQVLIIRMSNFFFQ